MAGDDTRSGPLIDQVGIFSIDLALVYYFIGGLCGDSQARFARIFRELPAMSAEHRQEGRNQGLEAVDETGRSYQ
jgi:hypothetical protein